MPRCRVPLAGRGQAIMDAEPRRGSLMRTWGLYPRPMLFIMPLLSRVLGYIVISSNDDEFLARVLSFSDRMNAEFLAQMQAHAKRFYCLHTVLYSQRGAAPILKGHLARGGVRN